MELHIFNKLNYKNQLKGKMLHLQDIIASDFFDT